METLQVVIALVIGVVVISFAPALVWAMVIAGLVRMAREKMGERSAQQYRSAQPTTLSH
ncbi:MAG: hypothetical protein JW900_08475 [Anaerolineae bacterium]|nr:hypothetical protein [Anaerolineae bacterium]